MIIKLFNALEGGKHVLRAGFAGVFPSLLPSLRQLTVFIGTVCQPFTLPVGLIPAAKTIPETTYAGAVACRKIFDTTALSKSDEMGVIRVPERIKRVGLVLRNIADAIVAHAGVSRYRQNKQYRGNDRGFHGVWFPV